jgi:hypothetical protein
MFLISPIQLVHAQESNAIAIQPVNTDCFPTISVDFKMPNNGVSEMDDLTIEQLRIFENDKQVDITELTQQYRGILFTLVINPANELDLHDATGTSHYDKLSESLRAWTSNRSFQEEDSWSLVTNEGINVHYTDSAAKWVNGLSAYQPNFRTLQPDLNGLETAIRMQAERMVPVGMDKSMLFLTPPPTPEQIGAINALAAHAHTEQIQISVWMVSDPHYLTNDQGGALMDLASMTGGEFFHFTGEETIPNPEAYLASLGTYYTATYESNLSQSGTYPLRLEVKSSGVQVSGESQPFTIDIQPPSPIFITPQTAVTLSAQSKTVGAAAITTSESVTWQIMIAFPDGHPREIVVSRLYIDGIIVDVNDTSPFDVFTWEIPASFEAGEHTIQAEIQDSLGLSARTILTPLAVEYRQPETSSSIPIQQIGFIIVGLFLGGSLFLFIIWLVQGFRKQDIFNTVKDSILGSHSGSHQEIIKSAQHPKPILATLTPLDKQKELQIVHLRNRKTTLGSDPKRAQVPIISEGVQDVHALIHIVEKEFWLQDMSSLSGTWVNYEIIGTKSVQIHSGDLIHFGPADFRFTINEEQTSKPITVSKYEPYL